MTLSDGCPGERVDIAGMPVDGGGDASIAAPPVGVHSGDNSMITILEAGIYRVDLIRRDQGLIEQIGLCSVRK